MGRRSRFSNRYLGSEVTFMMSGRTYERLRLAQDLLRDEVPDGDLAKILERALAVLLEDLTRETPGS
jgi:hypothetical protein